MASPAGLWLGAETDRAGRVKVAPDLSVPGHPDIFVIGDTAALDGADGNPLPGVAPVAKQQGHYVAKLLLARQKGKTLPPFRYRDFGSLATIGRKRAVVQMGRFKLKGFIAWLLWCVAHIYFLIGFRNRLRGRDQLAVELRHVPARHAADHRHVGRAHGGHCRCRGREKQLHAPRVVTRHTRHSSARQRSAMISVNTMPMIA